MKSILKIIPLLFLFASCANAQDNQKNETLMNRKPVVAGQFYAGNRSDLEKDLKLLFSDAKKPSGKPVRAVISPHAGYVFSGGVAADAFNQIYPNKDYKRVFVIASSHRVAFNGASVYHQGNYETPLGEIKVDIDLCNKFIEENDVFTFNSGAHSSEHSIEVQLPFLQFHLKNDFLLVPIVLGCRDMETPKEIAEALKPYFTDENLFVISADFSHYPNYSDAVKVDAETADAIVSGSAETFKKTLLKHQSSDMQDLVTDICAWSSVLTLLYLSENSGLEYRKVSYKNSGDSEYGDTARVVGYWAISLEANAKSSSYLINENAKKQMLEIARKTLEASFSKSNDYKPDLSQLEITLTDELGVFVTLHKNAQLRGCIGRFQPDIPLYQLIGEMAYAAAFHDTRFSPLKESELSEIDIEISVLTPMKLISDISEIELGKHGIYITKGGRSGTFLPQVAEQTGWSLEEFLGHCSRDKAYLGWDGWKDADVYTYEAIVFGENDFQQTQKEAMFYKTINENTVQCMLCPNYCILKNGQTGTCLTRKAENGKLLSLSYGKLVAIHMDPIEKKPLYHFYPGSETLSIGSAGCNLHCKNCQNHHISQSSPVDLQYVEATPEQLVNKALSMGCTTISYTYNEPTVFYEFVYETAKLAHEKGLKNVIVLNGFINQEPLKKLLPYLDAANIDLKCFNDSIYFKMSQAHLEPVLQTLKTIKESNVWLEITNLIIPTWTNDMDMIEEMCEWLVEHGFADTPLHFSRFFPAYKMIDLPATDIDDLNKAYDIATEQGIKYVYLGNVRSKEIITKCAECKHELILRTGYNTSLSKGFNGNCPKCGAKIPGKF
ncbi:MAG: AmmeMemoRadiSam system radical SAM enzyme [Bacteroidales bacterium]|nr:AmmeMemoRadiSam system radical SAM enzyme [Bacteroidales bacterium]